MRSCCVWHLPVVLVLLPFTIILVIQAYSMTPVWHESAQLYAGLNDIRQGRFDTIKVNPPLVRSVAGTVALLGASNFDDESLNRPPVGREEFAMAASFMDRNKHCAWEMLYFARLGSIPFALFGAWLCWRWSNRLFGYCAGLVALTLWCFSPYILGHGATVMSDVPTAAMGVAGVYFFWKWLKQPRWLEVIIAGVMLGLAELCKFTLLVFYPMYPLLWIVYRLPEWKAGNFAWRDWLRQSGMIITLLLVSVYIINCGYLFKGTFKPLGKFEFQTAMLTGYDSIEDIPIDGANRFTGTWLEKLPVPLPSNMVQGIDMQRYDFERGMPSYLRGQWQKHGWWYYYLYALAIKVPLGTWCLLALAISFSFWGQSFNASRRDEMIVLVPGLVILIFVSSQTGFSVHSRYIILALPFLFIWTSKVGQFFSRSTGPWTKRRLVFATTVSLSLIWSVGSSLAIYPHSLSYFNELAAILPTPYDETYPKPPQFSHKSNNVLSSWFSAGIFEKLTIGPRNGPRHLLDSNIDWGQDLFYLEDWCESHPEARPIKVAYFGSYPLDHTKIESAGSPPVVLDDLDAMDSTTFGPLPGYYALSVSEIYGRWKQYRYFLHFEPVAMAGYSIYIYHITLDEANRARREMGLPEIQKTEIYCGSAPLVVKN